MNCQDCPVYKEQREAVIKVNNSVYDAAYEMWEFVRQCRKTCEHKQISVIKGGKMKALCKSDGTFKGIIPDEDTYNDVKNDKKDWKPHLKSKMMSVEIPYELFLRLLNLDRKQTPKKPFQKYEHIKDYLYCPICDEYIANRYAEYKPPFCQHCGQALDWRAEL